jgi:uncharacterized protein
MLRIIACLIIAAALPIEAQAQSIEVNRQNKTVAISTTDEATAMADIAAVTVGFEIYGSDYQSVYTDGGNISHAILEALHKAGVDDKSIESSGQSLEQNTNFDDKDKPDQRAKKQFVFHQSWEVSVSPAAAAEVVRAAVAAGANKSGAIDWRFSDRKALQAKAAEAALVKARAVASQMAEGLHVKLGDLIYASNETPIAKLVYRPKPGLTMYTDEASVQSKVNLLPALEIRPQTVREEATVYAVFAIE